KGDVAQVEFDDGVVKVPAAFIVKTDRAQVELCEVFARGACLNQRGSRLVGLFDHYKILQLNFPRSSAASNSRGVEIRNPPVKRLSWIPSLEVSPSILR